jgi:hypothetical protein
MPAKAGIPYAIVRTGFRLAPERRNLCQSHLFNISLHNTDSVTIDYASTLSYRFNPIRGRLEYRVGPPKVAGFHVA